MTAGKLAEIVRSILQLEAGHESAPVLAMRPVQGAANGDGAVDWAAVRGRLERLSRAPPTAG